MVAGGVLADAVIFSDVSYLYLAIVGALVSTFGVAHEVYGKGHTDYSMKEKVAELIKGLALGIIAIPLWYLLFTAILPGLINKYFGFYPDPEIFTSLSLIVSFGLSWFTVPIFDYVAKTLPLTVKSYVARLIGRGK